MKKLSIVLASSLAIAGLHIITSSGGAALNLIPAAQAQASSSVTLTVWKVGTGSGYVSSWPEGIDCDPTCDAQYGPYTMVSLTPVADGGSIFSDWSGCTSVSSTTCFVYMDTDRTVQATFTLASSTASSTFLTVERIGSGSGYVWSNPLGIYCGPICMAPYDLYTVVSLTPIADTTSSSFFAGWFGCTSVSSTICTVLMDSDHIVQAIFVSSSTPTSTRAAATNHQTFGQMANVLVNLRSALERIVSGLGYR